MKILITYASRHGSTREIAAAIAEELRNAGHEVELEEAASVTSLDGYGAVVAGSAVYVGKWLPEAASFVERFKEPLGTIPVWLFSSGPLGDETPHPPGDPEGIAELVAALGARDHQVFVGKLDKGGLGLGERLITRMVKAPEGDFRDWEAIRGWARQIEASLDADLPARQAAP